jgi:putative ABC transport system permease protein
MSIPLKYNLRNLLVRKVTTAMTVLGIALVVATFVALMAMADGLSRTLVATGVPENVVFLRKGAIADAASSLGLEQYMALRDLPQFATDARGNALCSPELCFQILSKKRDGGEANVILRGIRPIAFDVHRTVKVAQGRPLAVRAGELLVGKGVLGRYSGFELGAKVKLFQREWTVVGVLEAGGGSFESEVWCDLDDLMSDTKRSYFSAVFARLKDPGQFDAVHAAGDDPRINLEAKTELEYYREQSESAMHLRTLGMVVAFIMGVGAVFAAMNSMYAAISARTKEIGTLRALGFSRNAVTASFVIESMLLSLPGGVLGCILAIPTHGMKGGTMNMRSFADVSFQFTITPEIMMSAVGFSLAIGFFGGLLPARMGAQTPIVRALREI